MSHECLYCREPADYAVEGGALVCQRCWSPAMAVDILSAASETSPTKMKARVGQALTDGGHKKVRVDLTDLDLCPIHVVTEFRDGGRAVNKMTAAAAEKHIEELRKALRLVQKALGHKPVLKLVGD